MFFIILYIFIINNALSLKDVNALIALVYANL